MQCNALIHTTPSFCNNIAWCTHTALLYACAHPARTTRTLSHACTRNVRAQNRHAQNNITSGRFSCWECHDNATLTCKQGSGGIYSNQADCAAASKHGYCVGSSGGGNDLGSTALLIFGLGIVFPYILIGSLVQWRCREKKGMGAFPNKDFWSYFFSLVHEGIRFSVYKLKCGGGGSGSGSGGNVGGYQPYEAL